jgi:hypothetical protein
MFSLRSPIFGRNGALLSIIYCGVQLRLARDCEERESKSAMNYRRRRNSNNQHRR